MKLTERIYNRSPLFIQNFLIEAYGKRLMKRRYNKDFFNLLNKIRNRDRESLDFLRELQLERLKRNLSIAAEHSPYYQDLFRTSSFNINDFHSIEDIRHFPVLEKNVIRDNIDRVVNGHYKTMPHLINHTSGTTGAGLVYPETVKCEQEKWAVWWRFRMNKGIEFGQWEGLFTGRTIVPIRQKKPPYWRKVSSTNRLMFSMYHLNENTVRFYVDELNREKIEWLHGYPSFLSNLASLMLAKGLGFGHEIKWITIGAENLLESQALIMEKVFGKKPMQHYGLSEPVANISQCEFGQMHVDEDYALVEFLPVEGFENKFRIVGTSLANDAMLFLRYDTNDIVTIGDGGVKCPCSRESRIVLDVDGRREDFITLKNGTKIGRMDHIFKDMVNVKEAQIRQDEQGFIRFMVVKTAEYSELDENQLQKEIRSRIDADYFDIIYVDNIPKTKGGKLRFVISQYEGPSVYL